MSSAEVTSEALNTHLKSLSPNQVEAFRAKIDPVLFDELYKAGLSEQAQALFLSEPQWSLLIAGLTKLVVLAFVLERSLAYLFEHPWILALERDLTLRPAPVAALSGVEQEDEGSAAQTARRGLKSLIALGAAWGLCSTFNFNILAGLYPNDNHTGWGILLTAIIVAGGSQGAVTLMQSVLGLRASTRKALRQAKEANAQAAKEKAEAEKLEATAKKQKMMNELVGQTIHKLLADKNKSTKGLAVALSKTETEVENILAGKAPVGEGDKDKIAQFLDIEKKKIFGG